MRDHFAAFMGAENALDNPNELMAYGYDASGMEGKARIVLFPKSAEELRQILTYANRTNIPVITRGLGANPLGMVVPENAIVLDMSRFDRIHTLNLKEGWVNVECGVVLSDLQYLLRKHGYAFPVNPQSANVATIGGLLAMNQMDRRSHNRGRLKEHVLSTEVIDGTGKHYPSLDDRFVGMEGTSAIIISARIKVYPIIEKTSTDVRHFSDLPAVLGAAEEKKDDLTVLSLEYLNPKLSRLVGYDEQHTLLIEYAGENGEYKARDAQERAWKRRDDAWETAARAGYPVIEDLRATPDQLAEALGWINERGVPAAAHIGMGIIHPFFSEHRSDYIDTMQAIGVDLGGQFGYGLLKRRFVPGRLKDAMIRQKDEFDYNDILGRGRIHDYA